ncbi:MAG: gamma-glutamyl-gamma-aminobutyrate hydrolase family protein [Bacteroidales bacterium]|nr:gamma-glutamyl-gamma-aminobutyrate hydrolase family protein [Bacteroidales bacterium]MBN2750230.1 gamma-glutamyl-gamma-aminobutyrate hydrolase family protein [Bacteroidales bacterium]
MKKITTLLIALIVLTACSQPVKDKQPDDSSQQRYIVLMNPTVNNIKTFKYLTENGIFTLPAHYKAIGVYHTKQAYNFQQTADFLRNEGILNVELQPITEVLNPSQLYQHNSCTEQFTSLFKQSEGIIFFGGPDMPPATYNEPTNLLTVITDAHRHYMELSFLFHLLGGYQDSTFAPLLEQKKEYRILGICLGMQSMNVATGGTMVQDIPTELYQCQTAEDVLQLPADNQHRNYFTNFGVDGDLSWGSFHRIRFTKESNLNDLQSDETPMVWSSHHQAIERMGKGFIPVATSMDGKIVEAVTHTEYPNVVGVQFHPEVPDIYKPNVPIHAMPNSTDSSYAHRFPNIQGVDFHNTFWKRIGGMY